MLSKITSIDQSNYPEMMGHTCIINAPGVFKVIWSILKPMLDPRTQAKIEARHCLHTVCMFASLTSDNPAEEGDSHPGLLRLQVAAHITNMWNLEGTRGYQGGGPKTGCAARLLWVFLYGR